MNAKELRDLPEARSKKDRVLKRSGLYLVLDNVYDTYNIGGLFRLADALAMKELLICGNSETPPNHRIKKASIGTYKVVPWKYHETTLGAIEKLRRDVPDIQIVALELSDKSIPYNDFSYASPLALVVGHETDGIPEDVLKACDAVVDIPMLGYNISLNVIVSAAIVAYHALDFLGQNDV